MTIRNNTTDAGKGGLRICLPLPGNGPSRLLLAVFFVCFLIINPASASAETAGMAGQRPLSQTDIDGYIYLIPRLVGEAARNPEVAAAIIRESGLNRRRAVYVTAKVAIAQAMATGALSPAQLADRKVPAYLHPNADEITLVNTNLTSLMKAQAAARRAAGDSSPVTRGN